MTTLFSISMDTIAHVMLGAFLAVTLALGLFALRHRLLLVLSLRNIPRRRAQSILIVCGLMLATVIITSALGAGDTLSFTIRSLATSGLGATDETISRHVVRVHNNFGANPSDVYLSDAVLSRLRNLPASDVDGVAGVIALPMPLTDLTTRQSKAQTDTLSLAANYPAAFGPLTTTSGATVTLGQLGPREVYVNNQAGYSLDTHAGDRVRLYVNGRPAYFRVRAVLTDNGLAGSLNPEVLMPLGRMQQLLGRPSQLTGVIVSNRGDALGGVSRTNAVLDDLHGRLENTAKVAAVKTILATPAGLASIRHAAADRTLTAGARSRLRELQTQVQAAGVSTRLKVLVGDKTVTSPLEKGHSTLAGRLRHATTSLSAYYVSTDKQNVLQVADAAGSGFTAGFLTFGLFSIMAGIMLIFLLFIMLAAERRTEMGISRAIGTKRRHLIEQFIFEGYVYDIGSALIGVVLGIGVSLGIATIVGNLISQIINIPVQRHIEPRTMLVAFCVGMLVTFITVAVSSWYVSRLNIVAAIRDLPDDIGKDTSIAGAFVRPFKDLRASWRRLRSGHPRSALGALLAAPWHLFTAFRTLITRGPLLIIAGVALFILGNNTKQAFPYGFGLSLCLIGGALLLRWILGAFGVRDSLRNRLGYSLAGLSLVVYWLLPFDFFRSDLNFGIEMFFLSGMLLMLGGVWTVMYNLDLVVSVLVRLTSGFSHLVPVVRMAVTYPMQYRLRTGLTLFMFSLVVFALMVEAALIGSFGAQKLDLNAAIGGYQVYGSTSVNPITNVAAQVRQNHTLGSQIAAAGSGGRLPANYRGAGGYTSTDDLANIVDSSYLTTTHFTLRGRAIGFGSDAAVWRALLTHPGYAVAPAYVAAGNGNSGGSTVKGLDYKSRTFAPVQVQMKDQRTGITIPLTVIGLLDNASGNFDAGNGYYLSAATLAAAHDRPVQPATYYFRVRPGSDVHKAALAVGSAFLPYGLDVSEAQVQYDKGQSFSVGFNNMLEGFMALGLIVGIAALGVIATRAVVERRQQIGLLRAIGFQRGMVRTTFLLESSLVALLGVGLGVVLGLLLAHSVVIYFAKTDPGLHFVIPWLLVGGVVLTAYVASLLTTYLPAWQASRVYPAEALRYE